MKQLLNKYPLVTALSVMLFYFIVLAAPALESTTAFGGNADRKPNQAPFDQMGLEVFFAVSAVAIVAFLGWGRTARLTSKPDWKGTLYALIPAAITLGLLGIGLLSAHLNEVDIGAILTTGFLLKLVLFVALVGIFEEVLFRGIVFHGLELRTGPVLALFISSFLFGSMHYVNWISGQNLADTHAQVLHAGFSGILYAAITLRTNSVWPGAVLHALWDGVVTINGAIAVSSAAVATTDAGGFSILAFLLGYFEPILGVIILGIWYRWHRSTQTT